MKAIYWLRELADKDFAGEKAKNFGKLYLAGFPVPSGFVITSEIYKEFLTEISSRNPSKVRDLILSTPLPVAIRDQIVSAYRGMNTTQTFSSPSTKAKDIIEAGRDLPYIIIRVSAKDYHYSLPNIKGKEDLIDAIKKAWSVAYPREVSIIVQKMVNPAKAGLINSSQDITIKAGYGLGEPISSGKIDLDVYTLDKSSGKIKDKKLGVKEWALIRSMETGSLKRETLSPEERNQYALNDRELEVLYKLAMKAEVHYGKPVELEWAIEKQRIYVICAKIVEPVELPKLPEFKPEHKPEEPKPVEPLVNFQLEQKDPIVAKEPEPIIFPTNGPEISKNLDFDFSRPEPVAQPIIQQPQVIPPQNWIKVNAIVDMPLYAESIARLNPDGAIIKLEQMILNRGIHPSKLISLGRSEEHISNLARGISAAVDVFRNKQVRVKLSDIRTDQFNQLDGGQGEPNERNPLLGWRGIRRLLDQPDLLNAELQAIKRASETTYSKIGILLPFVTHATEVREFTDALVRNHIEADIGVSIETPASANIIRDLREEGIKFVSIDLDRFAELMLATDRNNLALNSLYNLKHPAILSSISEILKQCKGLGLDVDVVSEKLPLDVMEFLVNEGVTSISVKSDDIAKVRQLSIPVKSEVSPPLQQGTDILGAWKDSFEF